MEFTTSISQHDGLKSFVDVVDFIHHRTTVPLRVDEGEELGENRSHKARPRATARGHRKAARDSTAPFLSCLFRGLTSERRQIHHSGDVGTGKRILCSGPPAAFFANTGQLILNKVRERYALIGQVH